jgi:hypothetical protein
MNKIGIEKEALNETSMTALAIKNTANGSHFARFPVHHLAVAVAKHANFLMHIDPGIQHGVLDGTRVIRDINTLIQKLEEPLDATGAPVEIHTKEPYKIYNCLKNMPYCIKSMEITRGDNGGTIGTNRPLENTICVAIHHIDDKSYGGLCVLREWGATDMATIFVGYNPLQTMIWRGMLDDIPDDLFTTCILQSKPPASDSPSWAEGIYEIVAKFNKFPSNSPLPGSSFNDIFSGKDKTKNPSGKPLTFLYAQRSLAAYNFLQAMGRGHDKGKQVFIWEDGGYLNPIIDQAIQDNITVAEFRKRHMVPDDDVTDKILPKNFAKAMKGVFLGCVELTRNGYDMSAAIAETRPMNTNFFSIAASYEKIMLEGDSITLACLDALSQVLYSTGYSLRDRSVLVMGARGNLGRLCVNHLANILHSSEKQLWGCDLKVEWPKPKRGSIPDWANWSCCDMPLKDVADEVVAYKDFEAVVRYGFDVIFGWTGGPSKRTVKDPKTGEEHSQYYPTITGQDVADWLTLGEEKTNLYLISGSTKTVEFSDVLIWLAGILEQPSEPINGIVLDRLIVGPIPDQLSIAAVAQMWPNQTPPPTTIKRNFGTQFTFVFKQKGVQVTKTLYLVNNTMPVNFMYYGTPTEIMDLTYSQVTSCAVALMENKNGEAGIYPTDYNKKATDHVYLGQSLKKDYPFPPSLSWQNMSTKDTFNGAKTAYTDYYTCFNTVAKKIGMASALSLMTKSDVARGKEIGKKIKDEAGGKVFGLEEAADIIINMAKGIGGIDDVLEKGPKKIVTLTKFGNCPVYEAAKEVGLDDNTIEAMCRAGSRRFLDEVAKQLNPELSYRLREFRSEVCGGCVEEIVLD